MISTPFALLAVVGVVALLGPLLALSRRSRIPIIIGELLGGIVVGSSGLGILRADNAIFTFLASLGFGLTMFVVGSQVPLRDARLKPLLATGIVRAVAVGVVAAVLGVAIAAVFHTTHAALYAVLMASSSAAIALPVIAEMKLSGPAVLQTIAQIAIADTACIVALPVVIDPPHAATAALGVLVISVAAVVLFIVFRALEKRGSLQRFHDLSEKRHFALELRVSLIILFGLASIAVSTKVSIMFAGFAFGIVLSAIGEPRRLARQLFALNDGFLGPLFFVWLGASLSVRSLVSSPVYLLLALALAVGAVAAHLAMRLLRQPLALGILSAAQLGVPVAAATIGQQTHMLATGEPAAFVLAALLTLVGVTVASRRLAHLRQRAAPPAGA